MPGPQVTPKLKRKHEGEDAQRKKVRMQGKSNAGPATNGAGVKQSSPKPDQTGAKKSKSAQKEKDLSAPPIAAETEDLSPEASDTAEQSGKPKTSSKRSRSRKEKEPKAEEGASQKEIVAKVESCSTDTPADNQTAATGEVQAVSKKHKKKKQKSRNTASWSVSAPSGGWFLPQDAVFTPNEKFLITANAKALLIYSTETSLLASTLPAGSGIISAYALSATNPDHVYISSNAGFIILWDWQKAQKVGRWDIGSNVRQMVSVRQPDPTSNQDLVFCYEAGDRHIINVHALRTKAHDSETELKQILKSKTTILNLQVLLQGKIVIVTCANSVLIGKRAKLHKTALQDFEYVWREFKTPKRVTACDAYVRVSETISKSKDPLLNPRDDLDLAIGSEDGVIYLFEDIVPAFEKAEKSHKDGKKTNVELDALRPKRLHWHREAVATLKWSKDGNYLISGGNETVLVIWQLSTGKQQHLPHLTAAIESVVVSPSGSSYVVSLANNSILVLSTTELAAKTNIVGIQSRRIDLEQLPHKNSNDFPVHVYSQIPMVVDPKTGTQVIFSTPSSQPKHQAGAKPLPEPYMQTFDFAAQRPISRQALTRNLATDSNIAPDGGKILEPNVTLLQISGDGQWLASVDEWIPQREDMSYLEEGIPEFNEEERTFRREVYLKIWRWSEKDSQWMLETRIDAPHFLEDAGANARVLDLVSDPVRPGFATVGEDRMVRIWRPTTRTRDGVVVRGVKGGARRDLVSWSLDQAVEFSRRVSSTSSTISLSSRLSFSKDASVLAVGVTWHAKDDTDVVHLIDTTTGTVRRTISELHTTGLSSLAMLGRHLIIVGERIIVWDIVADELVYSVAVGFVGVDGDRRFGLTRLAVNDDNGTFAVSSPRFEEPPKDQWFKKVSSRVSIFEPQHPQPIWTSNVPAMILSLAATKVGRGYVSLDSSSSIRVITPQATAFQLPTPPREITPTRLRVLEGDEKDVEKIGGSIATLFGDEDLIDVGENDKPVVRAEQLQEIFEVAPSHALPPVKDLFNAVVDLYARKPRDGAVGALV
ncbi:WD40 repeat-like protein [Amniculicola lignicola CBS 123094]|uniref:WD40 repeat-like protein n=1 Tax=Amniculicola lignicola CBS 123094 TaxID=1392246 RepID=A0A6A5X0X4_9PLEO|nr:WD40 repeat-like protein [Amniculicola lignicola CBS 123094]